MSLSITESLRAGLDRATNRNGGILFVLFFLYSLLWTVATNTAAAAVIPRLLERLREVSEQPLPPAYQELTAMSFPLSISMPVALALTLIGVLWVLGETVRIISDRTFISEETEHLHEPTRWLGWATLSGLSVIVFLGGLFLLFGMSVGALAVVSPAVALLWALIGGIGMLILSVLFFFSRQEIAARDTGPIDALTGSWSLVRHNGVAVFGLSVVLALISVITVFTNTLFAPLGQLPATLVNIAVQSVLLVGFSAVTADAYRQLRTDRKDPEATEPADELDPNDEWNDPPL